MIELKKCLECSQTKPLEEYYRNIHYQDNLCKKCKVCMRDGQKQKQPIKGKFIYIIHHPKFIGWCKIGRANDPCTRLNSYQTGCPQREYKLYAAIYVDDPRILEHHFKESFTSHYEWVRIYPETALREMVNFINNNYDKHINSSEQLTDVDCTAPEKG